MKGQEFFVKILDMSLRKTNFYAVFFRRISKKSKKVKYPLPLKRGTNHVRHVSGVPLTENVVFGKVLTPSDISSMA
jgi:hypothetical protein